MTTLHLTILNPTYSIVTATACDSFYWHGVTYTKSGTYTFDTLNSVGCDSTTFLKLTIGTKPSSSTIFKTVCNSYTWHGITYTTSGIYTFDTINAVGCDSLTTLKLTVNVPTTVIITKEACNSYTWHGITYTQSGVYTFDTLNANGCDSTVALQLTVNNKSSSATLIDTACVSYTWHGNTYTTSGVYTFDSLNAGGCDSLTTLHLTILSSTAAIITASGCGNYTWHGTNYTTSGVYLFDTLNAVGCDSSTFLKLTIAVKPSNDTIIKSVCGSYTWHGNTYTKSGIYIFDTLNDASCDSLTILKLTIGNATTDTITISSCNSYSWHGNTYTKSGSYTFDTLNAAGCDSLTILHLTIKNPSVDSISKTTCVSYTWHGNTYTTSGVYTYDTLNAIGCDSLTTLHLTILNASTTTLNMIACESYLWHGNTYTSSGPYVYDTINSVGCDSLTILQLTIGHPIVDTITASVCNSYTWHGHQYITSGTYTYDTLSVAGCDSLTILLLKIKGQTITTDSVTACNSYTWHGYNYTTSGSYTFDSLTADGCDSLTTLQLNIIKPSTVSINISACNSYSWHGNSYTSSGVYSFDTLNTNGCDSLTNLHLTINHPTTATLTDTSCVSYTWHGNTYTKTGSYTFDTLNIAGCDSLITLKLKIQSPSTDTIATSYCNSFTWHGNTYTKSGIYTFDTLNSVGCDSLVALRLSINKPSTDTITVTACRSYTWHGTTYTTTTKATFDTLNASGCDSLTMLNLIIDTAVTALFTVQSSTVSENPCLAVNSFNITNTTVGADTYRWYVNGSLVSTSNTTLDTTFINANTYNVTLVAKNTSGCSDSITKPLYVYYCSVTSSSTGGLESNNLGAAIGERNFNLYKEGKNGPVQYTEQELIAAPKKDGFTTFGLGTGATTLSSTMPNVLANYIPYDQSAAVSNLDSITNALDVRATDFTINSTVRAAAFATKTAGGIYTQTKPICDRLKGGQVQDVEYVQLQGINFIQYLIKQPNGDEEYAISFSAGMKAGRNSYSIQSNWLMPDYTSEDTMFNYQLWAASPVDVDSMTTEVLNKLKVNMPVAQLNTANDLPTSYVSAISRQCDEINLTVTNNTSVTTGYFQLQIRKTENTTTSTTSVVPFTMNPHGKTNITIPVSDTYDANITMVVNNATKDIVYMADGIWGTNGQDSTTSVSAFNVSQYNNLECSDSNYILMRNAQVQVNTLSQLYIYKFLKGGAVPVDLSNYKSLHFTTNVSTEAMNLQVVLTKQSVSSWANQYSYTINNYQDGNTYKLALSDFKSIDNSLPNIIDATDITSVVFNLINPIGQSIGITTTLSNAAFSTEDVAYERLLQSRAVTISPNPNNGIFKVSFGSPINAQLNLTVVDVAGRLIHSQPVSANIGANNIAINLRQGLMDGIYFVKLEGQGLKYDIQRIFIQKK